MQQDDTQAVMIANLHLRSAWDWDDKQKFVDCLVKRGIITAMPTLYIGDWNTQPHEAPLAPLLAAELLVVMDNEEEIKLPTRTGGRRT